MFEVIGFLCFVLANGCFSFICILNLCFGGGDLGSLMGGWVSLETKLLGLLMLAVNIYFWALIVGISPFKLVSN